MITYFLIGTVWAMIFELKINPIETTMGTRLRQLFLWPIPVGAWCVGFVVATIQAISDIFNNDRF